MAAAVPQMPRVFGPERLDSLDRQILQAICVHGRDGQSFNKLVGEVGGFASRSTFAPREKRLERLNYIESLPYKKKSQMKRIRGKPTTLLVMRIATRMKSQCADLDGAIRGRAESIRAQKELTEDELDNQMRFVSQANDKIKGIFSLIGVYAVNLGESVAGDILLPMVVEDFRKLNSGLMLLVTSNDRLMHALADEKLGGIPQDQLRDDFKYAYGTELDRVLPKFSNHLKKLSGLRSG